MTQTLPHMHISFAAMLGWVSPIWLLLAGAGYAPTIRIAGGEAWRSQIMAGAIALAVVVLSGLAVVRAARKGPGRAAFAFIMMSMLRVLLSLLLAGGAWMLLNLQPAVVLIWLVIFQMALLLGEVVWLTRAMRRDAFLVALGEIRRGR
jgi:hypothetical protein